MKKTFLLLTSIIAFSFVNAQTINENCHLSYSELFKNRGVFPLTDGEYENIIISEVSSNGASCYTGKADIQAGKVTNMYLKFVDGTYERINKEFKSAKRPGIIDGVSVRYQSTDSVSYTVFFTTKLKPKPQSYMPAPNPRDL